MRSAIFLSGLTIAVAINPHADVSPWTGALLIVCGTLMGIMDIVEWGKDFFWR